MEIAKRGHKSETDATKEIGRSERGHKESGGKTDCAPQEDANKKLELRGLFGQAIIDQFGKTKGQEERTRGDQTKKRIGIRAVEIGRVVVTRSRQIARKGIRRN